MLDYDSRYQGVVKCQVCGQLYVVNKGTRGRPSFFCSKNCREIEKFKNALARRIGLCNFSDEAGSRMKDELFRIRNQIK